jgi:ABC-type glycerol-3-phosphate transport system permease component
VTTRQGRATPGVVLVMAALCLLWLIPTLGILVTSFRTLDAVNSSGWWTVFTWPRTSASSQPPATAILFLGEGDRQVVTVTLGGLIGGNQILGWQVVTGGAIITMAVPVLVFVSLQRYFVRGLTAGSVGG